jgi:hypothetical protein
MLKNDDIILVGNHRIKFVDPTATERKSLDDAGSSETIVMKKLEDIRQLLDRERNGNDGADDSDPQRRAADAS